MSAQSPLWRTAVWLSVTAWCRFTLHADQDTCRPLRPSQPPVCHGLSSMQQYARIPWQADRAGCAPCLLAWVFWSNAPCPNVTTGWCFTSACTPRLHIGAFAHCTLIVLGCPPCGIPPNLGTGVTGTLSPEELVCKFVDGCMPEGHSRMPLGHTIACINIWAVFLLRALLWQPAAESVQWLIADVV